MKFRSIRLAAYGPFSGVTIDLDATAADFHMIFGPNEAGKSSALRALRHMLFGIPTRTPDNFLHAYANLRVGARLVNGDGREIEFMRRKGQAKTLRGPDDESVLDDDALAPFLGGINRNVFEQMFAIGHEDLIQGGEEIISGQGRIGEALFAAGAGLIRLQRVQQGLADECGSLFKPSGSTPRINQTIAAFKAVRKNQKAALLPANTWQAHDRSLDDAQQRMEKVIATLGRHKQSMAKRQRIREALPLIARKKEIDAELVTFQGVPDLPDDFGEKRRDAQKDLKIATRDLERSRETIRTINRQIKALPVPKALIRHAAAIEALQHELGSFRKAQQDRPGLEGRMRTIQKQASARLAEIDTQISATSADRLKLPQSTIGEIQHLGKTFERLTATLETTRKQRRKLATRIKRMTEQRQSMPAPVDVSSLETAIQSAQAAGPIEKRLVDMRTAVEALENELTRSLKRQTLWNGPLADIKLRKKLGDLEGKKTQSATLATELTAFKSGLLSALAAAGAAWEEAGAVLATLIKSAQAHVKIQKDLESGIATADKELLTLKGEQAEVAAGVADLENALGDWKADWTRNVATIGLDADASPTAALAVIESIREARNQINEADVLKKRIDGIDRDSAAFKSRVDELVEALAPDLKGEPQDRAAELLYAELTAAREAESKLQGLDAQLVTANQEKEDAQKRISQCNALIASLCQEARCADADTLAETETRALTRKNLVREQDDLDARLRGVSAGATVDEFIAEASAVDADSIGPELEELEKEIQRLEQERSVLDQTIGTEKAELKRMDGSAAAAGHAEEAERLLASLESDVETYARLKIAAFMLARTVEQYREKHQGSLISWASELFSQMTLGAFCRLRAEYDEKGNPVLVGIRSDSGAQVTVEGMSDGTADQLYLAFRLASLEQYLEHNEPLPFVVDDILLRFDDDRSMATLKVLGELSQRTQVIFFTHHRHLVDLVETRMADSGIGQHVLGAEPSN